MGKIPSTNLTVVALSEMAKLEDNAFKYPFPKETIIKNTYVDNTFWVPPNLDQLYSIIKEIKTIYKQARFSFKKWIISRQDVWKTIIEVKIPHQIWANKKDMLESTEIMVKIVKAMNKTFLKVVGPARKLSPC